MNQKHQRNKEALQGFLKSFKWSHLITVEPSPGWPFSNEEIAQRFRQIEFDLNKRWLPSSFPKWQFDDRFWMICFAEGDNIVHQKHFHLLLHSPDPGVYRQDKQLRYQTPAGFIAYRWLTLPSLWPDQRDRTLKPLDIRALDETEDAERAAIYVSKTYKAQSSGYDILSENISWWDFLTPPNPQRRYKAV